MRKIMKLNEGKYHVEVFNTVGQANPYIIKKVWYDRGYHSKTLAKYQDFESVIAHLYQMIVTKEIRMEG